MLGAILILSLIPLFVLADSQVNEDDADGVWCYIPTSLEFFEIGDYAGEKTFASLIETGDWTGTFTGTSTDYGTVVFHPSGPSLFIGTVVFDSVDVGEASGGLELDVIGDKHTPNSDWEGTWIITGGTGGLAGLQGHGKWWGPGFQGNPAECGVIYYSVEDVGAAQKLEQAIEAINGLDDGDFKNPNKRQALIKKIDAVLKKIEQGRFQQALDKLEKNVLVRTDGCTLDGTPDKNDWIMDCDAQSQVYPLIMDAIALLKILVL